MLTGTAHKFGDDVNVDLHIFDKHNIFSRPAGDATNQALAETMLSKLDPDFQTRRRKGDFVVAGRNFGALSMYDQSATILKLGGLRLYWQYRLMISSSDTRSIAAYC